MSIVEHAKKEFIIAEWMDEKGEYVDPMQKMMCEGVLDLLEVFSSQGHSGFSSSYARNIFHKLVNFEIISPLTGKDEEWVDLEEGLYQNKRLYSVFRENGKSHWQDGYIFKDANSTFTSKYSKKLIPSFPWTKPESQVVDVTYDKEGETVYPEWVVEEYNEHFG